MYWFKSWRRSLRIQRRLNRKHRRIPTLELLEERRLLAAHIVGSTTAYSTIQAAVNAASAGAVITVDAGTYPEQVVVTKSLTLKGAQAGVDARNGSRITGSASETVVTGALSGSFRTSAFSIKASDVTIDGFTVQGETNQDTSTGAGIVIAPKMSGTHIFNNVIQNNVSGIFLANNSSTDPAIIQYNLFRNNNNAGSDGGRGIYTDQGISGGNLTNVTIDSNAFINNRGGNSTTTLEAACAFEASVVNAQSNIRVTNNVMDHNGKAVLFFNTTGITITGNYVTDTLDQYSGTLRFEGNNHNVTIDYNTVYDNTGPAVAVDSKGVPGDSSGFVVNYNNFYGNSFAYGSHLSVVINGNTYDGPFNAQYNWWGNASGPGGDGPGTGDTIYGEGHVVSGSQWYTTSGGTETFSPWATSPPTPREAPYWGLAPGSGTLIQAEDYNHGGEGIAYHDADAKNQGGQYRLAEGVDVSTSTDTGGGYTVGWNYAGEWDDYTLNLAQGGTYRIDFRVGNAQTTSPIFHVNCDGQNVTGPISVPSTGSYNTWTTISATATLPAGTHVLRISYDQNGNQATGFTFNWFQLTNTTVSPPPTAPTSLVATAPSYTSVNLSWQDSANDETGFLIERSIDGVNFTQIATTGANVTSYTDTNVLPNTTYSYRVRATNLGGNSAYTNTATVTTPVAPLVYLSDLNWASATNGWGPVEKDMSVGGQGAGDGHTLTLNGVTYAKGLGTNAISQIVYNLGGAYTNFLCDVGIDDEEATNGTVDFQVLADGTKIFDSGVMTPTSATQSFNLNITGVKQLTLICGDAGDGPDYDHGDWAGARLIPSSTPVVPVAPSNLSASAISSSQINLSWTDNSSNESSFKVQRSIDGTNFTTITTLAANTNSYSDTGLSASTTYSYRVIASNGAGDSSPSNVAPATTFAAASTVTYLSDLNWVSATNGWGPVEKDMSVGGSGSGDGHTLTLNGVTYAKGLGTNAISQIVYNLGGAYTNFLCDVGIDDEETVNGTVDFQVLADGVKIFDSGVMTPTSTTQSFNLNMAGVQQLTLICGDAGDGPDYDHGDWAGARLISSAPAAAPAMMALATPASTITPAPAVQPAVIPAIEVTATKPTKKEIRAARVAPQRAGRQARLAEAKENKATKKTGSALARLLRKLTGTNNA